MDFNKQKKMGVTANSVKAKVMLEKRIKHQMIIIKQKKIEHEAIGNKTIR